MDISTHDEVTTIWADLFNARNQVREAAQKRDRPLFEVQMAAYRRIYADFKGLKARQIEEHETLIDKENETLDRRGFLLSPAELEDSHFIIESHHALIRLLREEVMRAAPALLHQEYAQLLYS